MIADDPLSDEAAWDAIVTYCLRTAAALALAALVFIEFVVMDVHWATAMLVGAMICACLVAKIGAWTLRKFVLATTLYAVLYLVGALPAPQAIGVFIGKLIA